jgi:hypothetical protein
MTHSFPGGVTDPRGERCFIETAPGELTAVELKTGQVCWRMTGLGRPIAATASRLLTVVRDADSFQMRIIDARSGVQTAAVQLPMIPAQETSRELEGLQIEAVEVGPRLRVSWHLRPHYSGGARPSAAAASAPETSGAFFLDIDSGTVQLDDAAPARTEPEVADAIDLGPHAEPTDDVLGIKRMGDSLYSLKMEQRGPNDMHLKLEAKDALSGSVQWETGLSQIDAAPPEPQRE